ncbi:hypothetical protein [Methanosphaerula palustris]|nr:hypothetical protein [Methanosphaerula palustris]
MACTLLLDRIKPIPAREINDVIPPRAVVATSQIAPDAIPFLF